MDKELKKKGEKKSQEQKYINRDKNYKKKPNSNNWNEKFTWGFQQHIWADIRITELEDRSTEII